MNARPLLVAVVLTLELASGSSAQNSPEVWSKSGSLLAIRGMQAGSMAGCDAHKRVVTGVVRAIEYVEDTVDILGVIVEGSDGRRVSYYIDDIDRERSNAALHAIRGQLMKGTRVKIVYYRCGNAGIPSADEIWFLPATSNTSR